MTSLIFPDVNVWLAVLLKEHTHHAIALEWFQSRTDSRIAFCRLTQIAVLRVLTTTAAMGGRPLTMSEAWLLYKELFEDRRVTMLREPRSVEAGFELLSSLPTSSPKLWADLYLVAFVEAVRGTLVTFDRALSARSRDAILLTLPARDI